VRRFSGLLAVAACVAALVTGAAVAGSGSVSDSSGTPSPAVDTDSAIVQLNGDPLSTYVKTKPPAGKKIDFSSNNVKSYRAQLSALRNDFKQWLHANAPKANITGQFDISLNAVAVQLNGTPLSVIRSAPQVKFADYEAYYTPQASLDPDLPLISAFQAWGGEGNGANAGVEPNGTRVKVGVIDTGIDITSPCFNDAGYSAPQGFPQGPPSLTNNKVIVAKVFYNKANNQGLTPAAVQEHGTHVSGTIACDYGLTHSTTSVDGVTVPYGVLGVAPGAQLGNYNVFPGNVTNARSEDILNALEAAYSDGMDIVNMSLGGVHKSGTLGVQDLLTTAVDDLDQAGMISAIAAGNSGPGHQTIESPGSAARGLTAGAFTVGHFIGAPVTAGGTTYGAATGSFAKVSSDLTATLAAVAGSGANGLNIACSALAAGSLTGKIALVSRGTCTFSTKIRNAQNAGAVAVLVGNNVGGGPIAMGTDGTPNQPTIPAYMLSLADAGAVKASDGTAVTIGATLQYFQNAANSNIMAGFSSQGPTFVDFRVKPDVVSPGVNVLSSIPHQFCAAPPCWAFFQGTSMATPHLAGSAAVILGQHPGWSAAQVRSAIVNTADQGVIMNSSGLSTATDVNLIGAGRDDVNSATHAAVALDPVSVSFGSVPSGSGQTRTFTVALSTLNGPAATSVSVTNQTGNGVSFSASLSNGTITVTMNEAKGTAAGDYQAILRVKSGGTEIAHAVVYTNVK
jgi:minor extracellular serine protease Vpr